MARKVENQSIGFAKVISIALMVISIVVTIYSIYSVLTLRSVSGAFLPGGYRTGNVTFNQTHFNRNLTAVRRGGLSGFTFASPDMIIIGILLILLGFVTYKYAGLKAHISR